MTPDRARELLATVEGVALTSAGAAIVAQVDPAHWAGAARVAKEAIGCAFFSFLTAIDWKEQGLEIVAWVDNLDAKISIELRTKLGAGVAACASLTAVYRGANWMERECFDMFGVRFDGHPDLRRMLLPEDWQGHPLLKSYAVDTPYPPYR